jgi:hypothetical protein
LGYSRLLSSLFDLESVRPKSIDHFMEKRLKIIKKGNLTDKDREKLKKLENEWDIYQPEKLF